MEECQVQPIKYSEDYFLSLLYRSNRSENEIFRILQTLNRYVKQSRNMFYSIEINENIIKFKPLDDLADDCLISISLFEKHIKELRRRHAAPPPSWYVFLGTDSFRKLGYYGIARDYEYWIDFIREQIVV